MLRTLLNSNTVVVQMTASTRSSEVVSMRVDASTAMPIRVALAYLVTLLDYCAQKMILSYQICRNYYIQSI